MGSGLALGVLMSVMASGFVMGGDGLIVVSCPTCPFSSVADGDEVLYCRFLFLLLLWLGPSHGSVESQTVMRACFDMVVMDYTSHVAKQNFNMYQGRVELEFDVIVIDMVG